MGEARALLSLLLLLAAAVGVDAMRIGFFADDFHFLDVARRTPMLRLLSGQYGMWPWFRPLSRELYFKAVVSAGPASLALAHALSLACLFGCAWLLWRVGHRLVATAPAAVAPTLFLSYNFTKFLAAWPSGFQDLLALFLVLMALDAHLRQRSCLAIFCAFLAPFAKESGFLVFPILVACDYVGAGRWPGRAWSVRLAAAGGVAALAHVMARLMWHTAGGTARTSLVPERLAVILREALGGFVGRVPVAGEGTVALALTAGVSAALWLRTASPPGGKPSDRTSDRTLTRSMTFVAVSAGLGLAAVIVGHLLNLTYAHAYHTFPAAPWIALLLASAITRLPGSVWRAAVPVLVAWNIWGLGYAPPDLDHPEGWGFHRWDWQQTVRFSAVTRRLADDVREQLADRPESLVVLYEGMPPGCYFQTQDGPATREVLRDQSARAYWINDPPADVTSGRLAILTFDTARLHLVRTHWATSTALFRAMNAIMARRDRAANAFALYEDSPDSAGFDRAYLRAAAALLNKGPDGFVLGLRSAGLTDTLGEAPTTLAEPLMAVDPLLGRALLGMLRHPLGAASHLTLADLLLARGALPRAGLELRIAVTLDPARLHDRYRLAGVMVALGGNQEALAELHEIADNPSAGSLADEAHNAIERLIREDPQSQR